MRTVAVLAFLFTLYGCHSVSLTENLQPGLDHRSIPLTVGVLVRPEFENYVFTEQSSWIEYFRFPLGRASTDLIHGACAKLFTHTVLLSNGEEIGANREHLNGAIEPAIEEFRIIIPNDFSYRYSAHITYRFTLYSSDGRFVGAWSVSGTGSERLNSVFDFNRARGAATDAAMQAAMRKFVTEFEKIPQVREWLKLAGVRQ